MRTMVPGWTRRWGCIAVAACAYQWFSCAAFTSSPGSGAADRVVHIKVVADPSFASHALWQRNAANLIATASAFFRSWFGLTLTVDTFAVWDIERSACYTVMFDWDCLLSSVDPGSSDIVVHFSKERNPWEYDLAGISLLDVGYVRVTQADWPQAEGGYQHAYVTLVHELGHEFGAFHAYCDERYKELHVMNPMLSQKLLVKEGVRTTVAMPDWHPANAGIIRALRSRPFQSAGWGPDVWPRVEAAYREARAQYLTFSVTPEERLRNYEYNELYQPDYYYFMANWAALCGMDSCAFVYVDSMATVLRAMQRTCLECGPNCQTHFCAYTGRAEWRIEQWLDRRLAAYHYERSLLHLRFGRVTEAERDYAAFVDLSKALTQTELRRYREGFNLYRSRLVAPAAPDTSSASQRP